MLRTLTPLTLAILLTTLIWNSRNYFIPILSRQGTLTPETINADFDPTLTTAVFNNQEITIPQFNLAMLAQPRDFNTQVLSATTTDKRLEVDLTNQRIYAFEGAKQVHNFLISSGKWGKTPTGIFNIWIKLRSTKMSGGNKALRTYYYLPNVPYVMYFANGDVPKQRGFGIHGAYWHNNFGHPMSHGCVNMKPEEAGVIYNWAQPQLPDGKHTVKASDDNPGTPIVIYGTAPSV